MKLTARFRKLSLWNKLGALGALASILALGVTIWMLSRPDASVQAGGDVAGAYVRATSADQVSGNINISSVGSSNSPVAIAGPNALSIAGDAKIIYEVKFDDLAREYPRMTPEPLLSPSRSLTRAYGHNVSGDFESASALLSYETALDLRGKSEDKDLVDPAQRDAIKEAVKYSVVLGDTLIGTLKVPQESGFKEEKALQQIAQAQACYDWALGHPGVFIAEEALRYKLAFSLCKEVQYFIHVDKQGMKPAPASYIKAFAPFTAAEGVIRGLAPFEESSLGFKASTLTSQATPEGWFPWNIRGSGSFRVTRPEIGTDDVAVAIFEEDGAMAVWRAVNVDVTADTTLSWSWAAEVPGADLTARPTGRNYPCQVIVAFDNHTFLQYSWSTTHASGKMLYTADIAPNFSALKVARLAGLVLNGKDEPLDGVWRNHRRRLLNDLESLYPSRAHAPPTRIILVGIQTLSHHPGAALMGHYWRLKLEQPK